MPAGEAHGSSRSCWLSCGSRQKTRRRLIAMWYALLMTKTVVPIVRFQAKYDIDASTGCWNWTAATSSHGYSNFWNGAAYESGHKFSYRHHKGEVPKGLHIDHLCRNRVCVNPDHLEAVTQRVNTLRGDTVARHNSVKTHCPRGHEYNETNTHIDRTGARHCRPCGKRRRAERVAKGLVPGRKKKEQRGPTQSGGTGSS